MKKSQELKNENKKSQELYKSELKVSVEFNLYLKLCLYDSIVKAPMFMYAREGAGGDLN